MGRDLWRDVTSREERRLILGSLAQTGRWVTTYYGWRPNLPDEADNHLIELAVAGQTAAIVTHNGRDLARGELNWRCLRMFTPAQCL